MPSPKQRIISAKSKIISDSLEQLSACNMCSREDRLCKQPPSTRETDLKSTRSDLATVSPSPLARTDKQRHRVFEFCSFAVRYQCARSFSSFLFICFGKRLPASAQSHRLLERRPNAVTANSVPCVSAVSAASISVTVKTHRTGPWQESLLERPQNDFVLDLEPLQSKFGRIGRMSPASLLRQRPNIVRLEAVARRLPAVDTAYNPKMAGWTSPPP